MQKHEHFDLLLHDDSELKGFLGEKLSAREPLHQWPLSSVEALTTASGKRLIYKVQREPTVEAEFLAVARSPILLEATVLQRTETQAALLLPFLTASTLRDHNLPEAELALQGRALILEIGEISGDVPVYRDLGSVETWRTFVRETLEMLSPLVLSGTFPNIAPGEVDALARWTETRTVLETIEKTSQLVHGDLKVEHVFFTEEGVKVIDWQRPVRAPGEVDLALLLESQKISPRPHVAPEALGVRWFLLVHWACEAKTNLLPNLPFFENWARQGIDEILRPSGA